MDTGNSSSITFHTTAFSAILERITGTEQERPVVATGAEPAAAIWRQYEPGDLIEPGQFELAIQFDPDERPPFDQPPEAITVTLPTGDRHTGTGFVTQWRSGELLADGLMRATVVIQWDGLTEPHFEEADALAIGGVVFAIDATTMRIGA